MRRSVSTLPEPPQMERAQSTPAPLIQEDDDPMPELQLVAPLSLADIITPLSVSTDSRKKRRKMNHDGSE
jgi:hypothetical protein